MFPCVYFATTKVTGKTRGKAKENIWGIDATRMLHCSWDLHTKPGKPVRDGLRPSNLNAISKALPQEMGKLKENSLTS